MRKIIPTVIAAILIINGCKSDYNRMKIVNYKTADNPETLTQNFQYAYFDVGRSGDYYIVLESFEPMTRKSAKILKQVLYAKLLWRPIPGRTYAESSQINARIEYLITVTDAVSAKVVKEGSYIQLRYTGTGFICFSLDRKGKVMTGTIEQALLEPVNKTGQYPLGKFIFSGKFRAVRNPSAIAECRMTLRTYRK